MCVIVGIENLSFYVIVLLFYNIDEWMLVGWRSAGCLHYCVLVKRLSYRSSRIFGVIDSIHVDNMGCHFRLNVSVVS